MKENKFVSTTSWYLFVLFIFCQMARQWMKWNSCHLNFLTQVKITAWLSNWHWKIFVWNWICLLVLFNIFWWRSSLSFDLLKNIWFDRISKKICRQMMSIMLCLMIPRREVINHDPFRSRFSSGEGRNGGAREYVHLV